MYALGNRLWHPWAVRRSAVCSHCHHLHRSSHTMPSPCDNHAYGWASAPPTASYCRQCRTGWPKALQATSAAGLGGPHDVRKRVVRGQAVGFPRCPIQRVGVRLTATSGLREGKTPSSCRISIQPGLADVLGYTVAMRCQLRHAQRGFPDSAGQAGRRPCKLRQPPDQDVRIMNERA